MPMNQIAQWAYWTLFVAMFGVLYLYYRFSYWVSVSDIAPLVDSPIRFSIFSGKIPPITSEDLVRGRLIVTDDEVALYQRSHTKNAKTKAKKVWSTPISSVQRFSIGKVIGLRSGLILSLDDHDEARFAIFFMKNKKADLVKAFGWNEDSTE